MKTTSSVESWHQYLAHLVKGINPSIALLINKLQIEQYSNEKIFKEISDGIIKSRRTNESQRRIEHLKFLLYKIFLLTILFLIKEKLLLIFKEIFFI